MRLGAQRPCGYVIGLTNAVRALIEAAPDKAAALAAVVKCFDIGAAMGQSFEYLDKWKREGLDDSLEELRFPIQHHRVKDADPDGLIAQAERNFRDRQDAMTAEVMAKMTRPPNATDSDEPQAP